MLQINNRLNPSQWLLSRPLALIRYQSGQYLNADGSLRGADAVLTVNTVGCGHSDTARRTADIGSTTVLWLVWLVKEQRLAVATLTLSVTGEAKYHAVSVQPLRLTLHAGSGYRGAMINLCTYGTVETWLMDDNWCGFDGKPLMTMAVLEDHPQLRLVGLLDNLRHAGSVISPAYMAALEEGWLRVRSDTDAIVPELQKAVEQLTVDIAKLLEICNHKSITRAVSTQLTALGVFSRQEAIQQQLATHREFIRALSEEVADLARRGSTSPATNRRIQRIAQDLAKFDEDPAAHDDGPQSSSDALNYDALNYDDVSNYLLDQYTGDEI